MCKVVEWIDGWVVSSRLEKKKIQKAFFAFKMHQASPTEEGDGTIHCQKVKIWPILAKIRGTMGVILIE